MKPVDTTGLGEPEPIGKKALFRPPVMKPKKVQKKSEEKPEEPGERIRRVRMTMELSNHAYLILQDLQRRYRLRTGKSLPLWKAASQAIEFYGKSLEGKT
jgi:hypothetical protein